MSGHVFVSVFFTTLYISGHVFVSVFFTTETTQKTCPYMSLYVLICPYMSLYVLLARACEQLLIVSLYVLICPYMSLYVLICPYISLHVLICPISTCMRAVADRVHWLHIWNVLKCYIYIYVCMYVCMYVYIDLQLLIVYTGCIYEMF